VKRSDTINRWPTGARVSASYAANKARAALVRAQLRAEERAARLARVVARRRFYRVSMVVGPVGPRGAWQVFR
jgi:hypothetical protein